MTSKDVRQKYLDFFIQKGHKLIPSSSLVPENDPTTLFTGSGMQPMIVYLLGELHPLGKRLVDSQKCFRSQDIDEVGDNRHTTFFEMLGNWSLGDYWKKDQLEWFFEFLISEGKGLGLDPKKIFVTAFEGNKDIPKDEETISIWQEIFSKQGIYAKVNERIFLYSVEKNWWSRSGAPDQMPEGEPGGPDSEVFYLFEDLKHDPKFGEKCHPNCDCGRFLEIGNSVFMQYIKQADGSFKELPQKNVDFGGGLERLTAAFNDQPDIFKIDLHWPIIQSITSVLNLKYDQESNNLRIVADHIKAAVFLIKDGVLPSNKLQGYVLRRLIRRSAIKLEQLQTSSMGILPELVDEVISLYKDTDYFKDDKGRIRKVISEEIKKFENTLSKGLKEMDKIQTIDGKSAFDLYQSYGFPLEITTELFKEKGQKIDKNEFEEEFKKHQQLSRTTSVGQFKGGLADAKEQTTKLHTANHLLQAALRQILGPHVRQHGSNINSERLRFDFSHDQKLTDEQIKQVEDLVNQKIREDLKVWFDIEDKEKAIKKGALANVGETYPEKAKVYKIGTRGGDERGTPSSARILRERSKSKERTSDGAASRQDPESTLFSQELCGGPHVEHTGVLGEFKILKQESIGGGLKRIYATVENKI